MKYNATKTAILSCLCGKPGGRGGQKLWHNVKFSAEQGWYYRKGMQKLVPYDQLDVVRWRHGFREHVAMSSRLRYHGVMSHAVNFSGSLQPICLVGATFTFNLESCHTTHAVHTLCRLS